MKAPAPHIRDGIAPTAFVALIALGLSHVPGVRHLGPLTLALLLGMAIRAALLPAGIDIGKIERIGQGIDFAAKQLLRVGIVLLGVRLDFGLLAGAGPRIVLLDVTVIAAGLLVIPPLGRAFGLTGTLPLLMAVDTSICGASAVAAVAPTLRARNTDVALVVPVGSLIGTAAVLGLTAAQHFRPLAPHTYGILTGATLQEIAQVIAAGAAVPHALEPGTVTKLLRVVLLAPVIVVLGEVLRRSGKEAADGTAPAADARRQGIAGHAATLWFVIGFLLVGAVNTLLFHAFPGHVALLTAGNGYLLALATFLMAMAMAGMGLQVDFRQLPLHGLRTVATGLVGWLFLFTLAAVETRFLRL